MEMLKVRAALEERLKQECILSSRASKSDKAQKRLKPVNGYFFCKALQCLLLSEIFSTNLLELEWDRRLVTYDDFDDDSIHMGATSFSNGHAGSLSTSELSQIVSAKPNKPKVIKLDCTSSLYV